MTKEWANSASANDIQERLDPTLLEQLNSFRDLAGKNDVRVDGISVAESLITENNLKRMQELVFNRDALLYFKNASGITRIEFISDGPMPPDLTIEPAMKMSGLYKQEIGYDLCKACRLCIEVCPKNVYRDDGTGRPDKDIRYEAECTGPWQCGKCGDICPENTISVQMADPAFASTLYVMLENSAGNAMPVNNVKKDFHVSNPLMVDKPLRIAGDLHPGNLSASLQVLNDSHFYPILEIEGTQQHLVDSLNPEQDIRIWASENYRCLKLTQSAVQFFLAHLPHTDGLKEGKYNFHEMIERIVDEIILAEINPESAEASRLFKEIVEDARIREIFFGAKRRPVGGLLPTGTSIYWKTPYGDEIPEYVHSEKCLGPECLLCITNCPEGSGGENSAIRMLPLVPLGVIPALARGLKVFVIKLDGLHRSPEDAEELTGTSPFRFEVNPEYCKACGVCIAYCPHEVIEPSDRVFDFRG